MWAVSVRYAYMDAQGMFVRELHIRNYSPRTIKAYRARIAAFLAFLGASPSAIASEDLKRFLDILQRRGASPPLLNLTIQAVKTYTSMVLHAPH